MNRFKLLVFLTLALTLISLFLGLSFWQYHRAKTKEAWLTNIEQQSKLEPIHSDNWQLLCQEPIHCDYRRASLTGYFDTERSFLLNDRFYQHQLGYEVFALLKTNQTSTLFVVERGWMPKNSQDSQNQILLPQSLVTLHGVFYKPTLPKIKLGSITSDQKAWPQILQYMDLKYIESIMQRDIFPLILVLDKDDPFALVHYWQPNVISPKKHLAYAFQWLLLAIVVTIGIVIVIYRNRFVDRS